jgi:hypothetical protein
MLERQNHYAMTSKRGSEVAMNPLVGQSSDEQMVLGAAQARYNRKKQMGSEGGAMKLINSN